MYGAPGGGAGPGGPPPYGGAPPPFYRPPMPYPPGPPPHLAPHPALPPGGPLMPHPHAFPPPLGAPPHGFPPPPPSIVHLGPAPQPAPPPAAPVETITRAPQSAEERLAATVYVGKLPPGLDDDFVRRVLSLFGRVLQWRRQVQDTGVPLGFGFADFESAECAARAVRVLHGFRLGERELLVKMPSADAQKALDAFLARRPPRPADADDDAALRGRIKELITLRDRGELPALSASGMDVVSLVAGEAAAEDKGRIVSAQIRMFRETTARFEKEKRAGAPSAAEAAKEREREAERKERARRREAREREREKERAQRAQEEREARERERRAEEREREREQERRRPEDEEGGGGPRSARERERRRREREREEKEDAEDRRREELERHARENPQANAPLRFGTAPGAAAASPASPVGPQSPPAPLASSAGTISLSLAAVARKRATANATATAPAQGFSLEEEQAQWVPRKKRELVRLDEAGGAAGAGAAVDLAALAEKVPTSREALYAWSVDWAAFDEAELAERRLRPWIVKKVIELVGEGEDSAALRDFILERLRAHTSPAELEAALVEVLDVDAAPLVQKLWRLLAFELLRLGAAK